jgi:RNA polymerase sigma-70 factor (ECF subfamily)
MAQDPSRDWDWPLIRRRCVAEASRILRSGSDAEEVAQEALLRAWRSRSACRTPDAPLSWCLQITRNEALRRLGRRPVGVSEAELPEEVADALGSRRVEQVGQRLDIRQAVQTLPDQDRVIVALRYGRDWAHPQIAAALCIPEATARVRLHRAQGRLRGILSDYE